MIKICPLITGLQCFLTSFIASSFKETFTSGLNWMDFDISILYFHSIWLAQASWEGALHHLFSCSSNMITEVKCIPLQHSLWNTEPVSSVIKSEGWRPTSHFLSGCLPGFSTHFFRCLNIFRGVPCNNPTNQLIISPWSLSCLVDCTESAQHNC